MAKTPCFQCRGHRFDPPGWESSTCHVVRPKKQKKINSKWITSLNVKYETMKLLIKKICFNIVNNNIISVYGDRW